MSSMKHSRTPSISFDCFWICIVDTANVYCNSNNATQGRKEKRKFSIGGAGGTENHNNKKRKGRTRMGEGRSGGEMEIREKEEARGRQELRSVLILV
jgi:hypothetical protein